MRFFGLVWGVALAVSALAQAPSVPLIDPRGVVDYFRPTPAPATVARGGILSINGTNLGPVKPVTAPNTGSLPTMLGTPAVQALLNGTAIPLFSVSANKVIAQVPYDAPLATVSITVSVGGVTGPAAAVVIAATQPSIRTDDDSGTGIFAGAQGSATITLAVSGLGATRPALLAGDLPGRGGAVPTTALIAYIGGVRVDSTSAASATAVGVFDVKLTVPPTAQPGDLINIVSAGRPSNAVVYRALTAPVIGMQPLPSASPDIISLATPDVTGSFVIPYAAVDASGCTAALWFDMTAGTSGTLSSCLTSPTRGAASPLVLPPNSEVAGGLVGPPAGVPPAGVSSSVIIASADDDSVNTVSLTGDASTLAGTTDASFLATLPGPPVETVTINGITGAVATLNGGAGGGGAAGAGAGAVALGPVNVNGLTYVVTAPAAVAAGQFGVVVADDPVHPTQAAYAVVEPGGTVIASQSFPAGWLPLIPAKPAAASPAVLAASRLYAAGNSFFVLARAANASQDAFLVFADDASGAPSVSAVPAGWFATSCGGAIRLSAISLYPAVVLAGSNVADSSYSSPCGSGGFLVLDIVAQTVTPYALGMGSQMNVSTIANFNDFIYGTNTDPAKRNTADSVFVFDAAYSAAYTIQLPAGAVSFNAAQEVAGTNWLLATVTNKTAGDGGFVQFDLEAGTASLFPIPTGFTAVELVGTFLATNKMVARGLAQGTRDFQLLVYDLGSGNVTAVQNPKGVASFGPLLPAATGAVVRTPAPVGNPKSNTVVAPAYDGSGNQTGILLVQIP